MRERVKRMQFDRPAVLPETFIILPRKIQTPAEIMQIERRLRIEFDSPLGMRRYLDTVMETAGLYNTAGFNDDTRAFASIPSRHDVWRRVSCDWLAGMVMTGMVDEEEARDMARDFAYGLARRAYGFQRDPVGSK